MGNYSDTTEHTLFGIASQKSKFKKKKNQHQRVLPCPPPKHWESLFTCSWKPGLKWYQQERHEETGSLWNSLLISLVSSLLNEMSFCCWIFDFGGFFGTIMYFSMCYTQTVAEHFKRNAVEHPPCPFQSNTLPLLSLWVSPGWHSTRPVSLWCIIHTP